MDHPACYAHLLQTAYRVSLVEFVCSVERYQMARLCRLMAISAVAVTNFTYHDDVGHGVIAHAAHFER